MHSEEVMPGAFLRNGKCLSDWLFCKCRLWYVLCERRLSNRQHAQLLLSTRAHSWLERVCVWLFVSVCTSQPVGNWEVNPIWQCATSRQGWTCFSRRVWSVGLSPFQDIVLTLKDKLSIRAIESFALVLEQQYSITKLLLLHDDEFIQKVKKTRGTQTQTFPICRAAAKRLTLNAWLKVQLTFRKTSLPHMAIFVFIRWSRKKTLMTTDVCSGCVSSPETLQTCCKMILLPLSICFCRYKIKTIQKNLLSARLHYCFFWVCVCVWFCSRNNSIDAPVFSNPNDSSSTFSPLRLACCTSIKPAYLFVENTAFILQSCQGNFFPVRWWMCVFPECWGCAAGAICSWDEV